jgi:PAS domain S-box-containing protein
MSGKDVEAEREHLLLRIQLALESGGMGTWSWDAATGRVDWDAATEAVYGLEPGTFEGTYEAYLSLLHPDDRAAAERTIGRSLEGGDVHRIKHRAIRPDGSVRWIEGWGRVLTDAQGRSVGLIGVSTDVTDRVRAEQQLATNAERLARLQEVTSALADAKSVHDVGEVGIEQLMQATGGVAATMYLLDREDEVLRLIATTLPDRETDEEWRVLVLGSSSLPAARAARELRVVRIPVDEAEGPTPRAARERLPQGVSAEAWAFPITAGADLVGSVVLVFATQGDQDAEARERFLLTIGRQVGQAVARAHAYDAEQLAVDRLRLLAEASELLGSSLDYEETITRVAEAAVPNFADWCSVELLEPDDELRSLAVAHVDPEKVAMARKLREEYPPDLDADTGIGAVMRTGVPQLTPTIPREAIDAAIREHPELAETLELLQLSSLMVVPLVTRGRMLGGMTFVSGESGRHFDEDDLGLAMDLARRAATAIENARLFHERNRVAETLETSLRPPALPSIPGVDVGSRYRPAGTGSEVAGDFYDIFEGDRRDWFAVVGDVAGKGAEAAAVMALARYTVRTAALGRSKPSQILQILNEALLRSETQRFCTATLLRLRPRPDGLLVTVSSGGHPRPLIVRRDGEVVDVDADGTLLGMFPEATLRDVDLTLAEGEVIVAYTDGVVEERTGDEFFGETRLRAVLAETRGLAASAVAGRIVDAVEAFRPEPPADDIAVMAMRAVPIESAG